MPGKESSPSERDSNVDELTDYINNRYAPQVRWYDDRANRNHRRFNLYQVLILVASTAVTIETAILPERHWWIAVGTAATVTLLVGLLSHFKYHEKWLRHRSFGERLKREQFYMRFGIGDYVDISPDKRAQLFVQRVEELIASEQRNWSERHGGLQSIPQALHDEMLENYASRAPFAK